MSDLEKKKNRQPLPRPLRPGDEGYDAEAKKELEVGWARLEAMQKSGDEADLEYGKELRRIRDGKLFIQGGFNSYSDFVVRGLGRSRAMLSYYTWLADNFSDREVERFGTDRLKLAQAYVKLTRTKKDARWSTKTLTLVVPGNDAPVPFRKATPADLEAAVQHQLELRDQRRHAALPSDAHDLVAHLGRSVTTETGTLALVEARQGKSKRPEDTIVRIEGRIGDMPAVLERMHAALNAKKSRGRG